MINIKETRRYIFGVSQAGSAWLFIVGTFMLLLGISVGTFRAETMLMIMMAIAFFILAIVLIVIRSKKIVPDEVYDAHMSSYIGDIVSRARMSMGEALAQANELNPLVIVGYSFADDVHVKTGRDGRPRSSRIEASALFFAKDCMYVYCTSADGLTGQKNDAPYMFYYDDITMINITPVSKVIRRRAVKYNAMCISTRMGGVVNISVSNMEQAQQQLNMIYALMRNKRQA